MADNGMILYMLSFMTWMFKEFINKDSFMHFESVPDLYVVTWVPNDRSFHSLIQVFFWYLFINLFYFFNLRFIFIFIYLSI